MFLEFNMKEIEDFLNYFITEDGRVFSRWSNKFLKFGYRKGYKYVRLRVERGKYINKSIHILVAITYIPNLLNLPQINHKDLNILNNRVGNLEWCTHKENIEHAMINGGIKAYGKSKYFGVTFEQNKWRVRVREKGIRIHVGCFKTEIEAAQAYNNYVKEWGLNRPLNKI